MRAQKFGVELSVDAKKEARAARFGTSAPINTGNTGVSILSIVLVAYESHVMGSCNCMKKICKIFWYFSMCDPNNVKFTGQRLCVSPDDVHLPHCVCVGDLHLSIRTSRQLSVSHKGYLTLLKLLERRSSHSTTHLEQKRSEMKRKLWRVMEVSSESARAMLIEHHPCSGL